MKFLRNFLNKISIFGELWRFFRVRKKWWLFPIIVFLVLFGLIMIFAEWSALSPFIYTIF